jgi:hypothetical protein
MGLLQAPKKPRDQKLAKLTAAQRAQLDQIELDAIADYKGDLHELEAALGMLRLGHHFGWKVLYIIHSKRTIRKYEEALGGKKVRELFPEIGPSSYRNAGYRIAQAASNFWKVVSGDAEDVKIDKDERRAVSQ